MDNNLDWLYDFFKSSLPLYPYLRNQELFIRYHQSFGATLVCRMLEVTSPRYLATHAKMEADILNTGLCLRSCESNLFVADV